MYEDERSVDEIVDEFFPDGGEKPEDEKNGESWQIPGEGTEQATCRRCGGLFLRPPKSTRSLCPACFSAAVSAGRKRSHAVRRERREAAKAEYEARKAAAKNDPAASSRQIKPEDEAQRAWDALEETAGGDQTPGSFGPDGHQDDKRKRPEDMTTGELADKLADGMRAEPGDVVLALYQAARDVARRAGIQTRVLIETMYEIDCTLAHIKGV